MSHELAGTSFPEPLDEINIKAARDGPLGRRTHPHDTRRRAGGGGKPLVIAAGRARTIPPRFWRRTTISLSEKRAEEALRRSRDELEVKVKERTAELGKMNVDLQSVNQELEAFAYSVSHDLRAPVRHIAGFTELCRSTLTACWTTRVGTTLSMILDAAYRMGSLVDDLLAFSRIGRAETQKTTYQS